MKKIRPAAIPLITVDPFFSIWSCASNLHDDCTRNWTEIPNPIIAGIYVDDVFYSMAATNFQFVQFRTKMYQTDVTVKPLTTQYTFENEFAKVELSFTTPLLLDRIDIMTRPVSYIAYNIERKCDESKNLEFLFGLNARCCINSGEQVVAFKKTDYSVCCGNVIQSPLTHSDDVGMIDWGYVHICDKNAVIAYCDVEQVITGLPFNKTYNAFIDMPYMVVRRRELSGVIAVAYDEIKPIEYFGKACDEYYTKYFDSFGEMLKAADAEYDEIKKMCDEFDEKLLAEAGKLSEDYQNIVSIAYRQTVGAHKLVEDENGDILFLSKECESNGCIGTLDVTCPSIPLFLKYNPELILGMLRPIIKYAKTDEWKFDFAPHDVGQYPLANGQFYGLKMENQMPVEECGNMILCLAAVAKFSGKIPLLFIENKELIKSWADYLVDNGYDPANQLCTDDFAGHLSHNCNLSLKAILGIAAYSMLSGDESYLEIAKKYAADWERDSKSDNGASRLVFDKDGGWSMKYNMAWDNLLGFHIFSDDVKKKEIEFYKTKMNRYGVPLDSRADYTKLDWYMWTTRINDDRDYFDKVCESIVNMINETPDRVPLTDLHYTSTAQHILFQNRSTVGAMFINLL